MTGQIAGEMRQALDAWTVTDRLAKDAARVANALARDIAGSVHGGRPADPELLAACHEACKVESSRRIGGDW